MAYLLDTNILSELRKKEQASPALVAWVQNLNDREAFLSVLTLGEVRRGVELRRMRDPETARHLERWLHSLLRQYAGRILVVTEEIADRWGRLSLGAMLPPVDGLLAATALHHDLTLVTRNVADVARSGVRWFNPFEETA